MSIMQRDNRKAHGGYALESMKNSWDLQELNNRKRRSHDVRE